MEATWHTCTDKVDSHSDNKEYYRTTSSTRHSSTTSGWHAALQAFLTVLIVDGTLFLVVQHLISFTNLLEFSVCFFLQLGEAGIRLAVHIITLLSGFRSGCHLRASLRYLHSVRGEIFRKAEYARFLQSCFISIARNTKYGVVINHSH